MRLVSLQFSELAGTEYEWQLDPLAIGDVNLLVGKNASGKSRVVNLIANLARFLAGRQAEVMGSSRYDTRFDDGEDKYHFVLQYENSLVTREELFRNDNQLLRRGAGGIGKIWAAEENKMISFQTPGQKVAAFARRDSIQHPFLQPLNDWGAAVRHFEFGKSLGHHHLAVAVKSDANRTDDSDTNQVVGIFHKGKQQFTDAFEDAIIKDMAIIGYPIENVEIRKPAHVKVLIGGTDVFGIAVKEKDLACRTDQPFMSQGMFGRLADHPGELQHSGKDVKLPIDR